MQRGPTLRRNRQQMMRPRYYLVSRLSCLLVLHRRFGQNNMRIRTANAKGAEAGNSGGACLLGCRWESPRLGLQRHLHGRARPVDQGIGLVEI